jgi:hypothetical protein
MAVVLRNGCWRTRTVDSGLRSGMAVSGRQDHSDYARLTRTGENLALLNWLLFGSVGAGRPPPSSGRPIGTKLDPTLATSHAPPLAICTGAIP